MTGLILSVFVLFDPVKSAEPPSVIGVEPLIEFKQISDAFLVAMFCGFSLRFN